MIRQWYHKNLKEKDYYQIFQPFKPGALITLRRAMEFKQKMKKACRVKNLVILCLLLCFLWWGNNAVVRYWSQPLVTDISYIFGETKLGVQFPQITLCQKLLENPIVKECHDGSWNFVSTLASCMNRNKSVEFKQNLHPEIENVVEMVRFWTGSEYLSLWPLYGTIWTRVVLIESGPCYMLDLSKVDKFKYVSVENNAGRPGIEFVMAENNQWQMISLLLHTRFDLPDAIQLNGYFVISFSDKIKQAHKFELRKKINKRESTRNVPCVEYEHRTCKSIEDNKEIIAKFNCSMPSLYSGEHLDNVIPKDMSTCSYDVTMKALDFYLNRGGNCSTAQTCKSVRFTSGYKTEKTWLENKTVVYVVFENPEVEYHHSHISYDLVNLIGELGGVLGLTLGASALTLFESLFQHVTFY